MLKYEASYKKAIAYIEEMSKDAELGKLIRWLTKTDLPNPYFFLPEVYAKWFDSAEGCAEFVRELVWAYHDDGYVAFVTVNDNPRIVFADKNEPDFREKCLSSTERWFEEKDTKQGIFNFYRVKILDISPDEFGPLCEKYDAELKAKDIEDMKTW